MPLPEFPSLRADVDLVPQRTSDGEEAWVFLDPEQLAETQVVVARGLGLLLHTLLDGSRDVTAITRDWEEATGDAIEPVRLLEILQILDDAHLLEGSAVQAWRQRSLDAYRAQPTRPPTYAGASYPASRDAVDASLARWRAASGVEPVEGPVCALLAPHIDPRGGGPAHGAAAAAMAASPAEVWVVLGTAHAALSRPFALTTLDYDTPSGRLPVDRELVERLAHRGGGSLLDDEWRHANEHSVEFQAAWIRHVHRDRPNLRVVPILVAGLGARLHTGVSPASDTALADLVAALRELRAEFGSRVAFVASIDLAHVGPAYGHAAAPDEEALAEVLAADRGLLARAAALDAEGWFAALHAERDARNVCGAAPTWFLLSALAGADLEARLLRHDSWQIDPASGSHVSFATLAWRPRAEERDERR